MTNPVKLAPDYNKNSIPLTPPTVALAQTLDESISSSTELELHASTAIIRVFAKEQDVFLKWGTSDVTSANFDEVIPAGFVLDFIVPESIAALNVIERDASASVIIIEK